MIRMTSNDSRLGSSLLVGAVSYIYIFIYFYFMFTHIFIYIYM